MSTPTQQFTLPTRGTFYGGVYKGPGEPFTLPEGADEPPMDAVLYPGGAPYWTPEKRKAHDAKMAAVNRQANAQIAAEIRAAEIGADHAAMPLNPTAPSVPTPTGKTASADTNAGLAAAQKTDKK